MRSLQPHREKAERSTPDKLDHARGYFLKAESDLVTVVRLLGGDRP